MSDAGRPIYIGDDGWMAVLTPPAGSPEGAILLSVSGGVIYLAGECIAKIVDLFAAPIPGVGITASCGDREGCPVLDLLGQEDSVRVSMLRSGVVTHQVNIPHDQAFMVACEIGVKVGGALCQCGKLYAQHTPDEISACAGYDLGEMVVSE
ncbi:hypothetical protein [Nonomuraea sp. NPDC049141]|uniref:hypothetical protein n=1 Tax=Nonomuraea sp. NPDC049141 TaxID=3155500 RepID=UPI0033DAB5A2